MNEALLGGWGGGGGYLSLVLISNTVILRFEEYM